jgi:hypothetical protein
MIDWLAVIVICTGGECAFWSDTQTAYESKADCERRIVDVSKMFVENGFKPAMAVCLPLKFAKI